jgi:hypothetical protein
LALFPVRGGFCTRSLCAKSYIVLHRLNVFNYFSLVLPGMAVLEVWGHRPLGASI